MAHFALGSGLVRALANSQLSIAGLGAGGVKRRIGGLAWALFSRNCLMTLWFVFALMTAAAIFAVLWPLGRHGQPQKDGSEAVVYKDQLTEIDRDVAAGLIGSSEAEAARVEISRRLLAAADNQRDPPLTSSVSLRRSAAIMALVGLPIVAGAPYLSPGSPPPPEFAPARPTLPS